jgi:hypothetical protein
MSNSERFRSARKGIVVVLASSPLGGGCSPAPNILISGCEPFRTEENSVFAIAGCGVVAGKFVRDVTEANLALPAGQTNITSDAQSIRGSLCLYAWSRSRNSVLVLPDPFGAALLFFYRGRTITAVSSDLGSLVDVIHAAGETLTLSIKYAVESAFIGNAGLVHTPYEEISVVPNFSYVSISSDALTIVSYEWASTVFTKGLTQEDGMEWVASEIIDNTRAAVATSTHRKVAHLTAGFDSRLVLATILHNDARDVFSWHTTGGSGSLDVTVASEIAQAEGMRMSHYPGYGAAASANSHELRIRAPLDYSEGLIGVGPHMHHFHEGSLLLSGGYGEILRSFFDVRFDASELNTHEQFEKISWVHRKVTPDRTSALMNENFSQYLHDEFCRHLSRGKDFGVRQDALLDYYYLANRNRYWVGLGARVWSAVCYKFDPLYSLAGAAVGLAQPRPNRINNFLGLDLMIKIRPQLLQYRYGREIIGTAYKNSRPIPILKAPNSVHGISPWIDSAYSKGQEWSDVDCRDDTFPKITPNDIEASKRARVSPRQWANRLMIRDRVRNLMEMVRVDDLKTVFNVDELSLLLRSSPSTMGNIRLLNSLHASLLWMQKKQDSAI